MTSRIFIYLSFLLFTFLQSFGQYSCQTAVDTQDNLIINLPAVGSIAPVGPDYGCAFTLTRPVWGYMPSCDSTEINFGFHLNSMINLVNYDYSFVLWGPFQNKNVICNDLTAAKIVVCNNATISSYYYIPPSVLIASPGEYYYYMLATSDTTSVNSYT